jgi:hypothetical protein
MKHPASWLGSRFNYALTVGYESGAELRRSTTYGYFQ